MQLTGGRFTSETALTGNDLATFPDFPAEIRAPAGSLPGVSGFQLHFADHDILTPGDRPDVLVAMNPAALKTNLGDLPKGGTLIVDTDAFTDRNLKKAGYESNPIEDGSLADYQVHAVQLTGMTVGALKEIEGVTRARGRAGEEHVRARADVVAVRPPDRVDDDLHREEVREAARDRRGEPEGVQHGLRVRRDLGGVRGAVRGEAREAAARAGTARSPATRRSRGGCSPRRSSRSCRSSSARTRSRRPRRSSRSSRSTSAFGVRTFQAEDEIAAVGRRARRVLRRRARRHDVGRPGRRAEVGDGRARDHARAAAADRSTCSAPARRRACRRSPSRATC